MSIDRCTACGFTRATVARLRALELINPTLGLALRRLGAAVARAALAHGVDLLGREPHALHHAQQLRDRDRHGNVSVKPAARRALIDSEEAASRNLGKPELAQCFTELPRRHAGILPHKDRVALEDVTS